MRDRDRDVLELKPLIHTQRIEPPHRVVVEHSAHRVIARGVKLILRALVNGAVDCVILAPVSRRP